MIRIDEIYENVFLPQVKGKANCSMHWFDPFGSTQFKDCCSVPKTQYGNRWLFWDQEPIYRHIVKHFFDQFIPAYNGNNLSVRAPYIVSHSPYFVDRISQVASRNSQLVNRIPSLVCRISSIAPRIRTSQAV